jgi:hypothetical protein
MPDIFSATATANGSSRTSTDPPQTVTSTATASATSTVSQLDAQTLANNTAQQVANSDAQTLANGISSAVEFISAFGPIGPTGERGERGDIGNRGEPGPTGANGRDGTDGSQGPTGANGRDGTDGTDGSQGPTGPTGPSATGGSSSPNTTSTVYFDNITDMNNFQLPTPDPSGSHYYDIQISSSLLGLSPDNFGYSPIPTYTLSNTRVYEYNENVYLYGTIYDLCSNTLNFDVSKNIISYDMSGNINNLFNFTSDNLTRIVTLKGTRTSNRLFGSYSGTVSEYNGLIEIDPSSGLILSNNTLKNLTVPVPSNIYYNNIFTYGSTNNLLLIAYSSDRITEPSGNSSNLVYYNTDTSQLYFLKDSSGNIISDINLATVLGEYLYLVNNNNLNLVSYQILNNALSEKGSLLTTALYNASFALINNKFLSIPFAFSLNNNNYTFITNNGLFQFNPELTYFDVEYSINNRFLSSYPTLFNLSDTICFLGNSTSYYYMTLDASGNNAFVNGYNPYLNDYTVQFGNVIYNEIDVVYGNKRVYYIRKSGALINYLSNKSYSGMANFLVTSTENINKVYIKNNDGGIIYLNNSSNSFYYNGTEWVLTSTSNILIM